MHVSRSNLWTTLLLSAALVHLFTSASSFRHHQRQRSPKGNSSKSTGRFKRFEQLDLTAATTRQQQQQQQLGSSVNSGQCPVFSPSYFRAPNGPLQQDRVQVDPETGKRTFTAKIIGIFSCLDSPVMDTSQRIIGHQSVHSQQAQSLQQQTQVASNDLSLDFRLAKPVIDLAVNAVNAKYGGNIQFNVAYRTAPDICKHQQAAGHAADEYYMQGANYFVGPGCSESLASVGQLASYWNVPMCSTGYLPEMVTQRFKPLTLMQLSISVQSVGEMLLELFQLYKWRHLVIVTDEKHPLHSLIRDGLLEFFHTMYMLSSSSSSAAASTPIDSPNLAQAGSMSSGASGPAAPMNESPPGGSRQQTNEFQSKLFSKQMKQPYYINITSRNFAHSKNKQPPDYEQVMLDAASYSRIMLLLARSSTITHLLEAAHNQDMSRGQFVFIAHELFETPIFEPRPGRRSAFQGGGVQQEPTMDNNNNLTNPIRHQHFTFEEKIEIQSNRGNDSQVQLMREIFSPLMTISLRFPTTPEFDEFRSQVASLSEREFNYRLQPSSLKSLYSLGLAAIIYDCVMLYADKVDFVLKQTQFSRIDGSTIFELAAGKTFNGALTGDLTINRAGQRVIDFTLNDFSPSSLSLEPLAHFYAIERRLTFLPGREPHWTLRNQSAPRSDPRCRVDLSRGPSAVSFCRLTSDDENHQNGTSADRVVLGVWLVVIIVLTIASTSSIIGWLVYRRFRIESELLNLWWSIKYEDILFEDDGLACEGVCDGKRSMSSLAISNESFQAVSAAGAAAHVAAGSAANAETVSVPAGSGRTSPAHVSGQGELSGGQDCAQQQQQQLAIGIRQPLVGGSSAPSPASALVTESQAQAAANINTTTASILGAAHSTSTLSVGGTSAVIINSSSSVSGEAKKRHHHHQQQSSNSQQSSNAPNKRYAAISSSSSGGASKLLPLLGTKPQATKLGQMNHSGGSSKSATATNLAGGGGGGGGSQGGKQSSAAAVAKDPSISSQNKNVKLRLGTVLNGRDQTHTTKVGLYKASRVAVKHLNVKNLNINRQLLIELRQVRDLTHENLIKFIGLCPEDPNVAIVSELCTRGNLQDLLQNETIRLDWPFRFSIINDIVDGLTHLHSSPLQFHGRLKSSNCVIDNRFVVKLTDFGLPTLLASVEMSDDEVNPRLLLWTAPEHLRTKYPLLSGSQKGDIYSLAIILQEIITRCGPFECEPILCGASEVVGLPAEMLQQQQQQAFVPIPPLIRTTDFGSGQQSRNKSRQQQQQQQPIRNSFLNINQQQQPLQIMTQPIVVQHKQRLEPDEIVNLVRMGLSPPFRPYFRPDVVTGAGGGAPAPDFNVGDLIATVQSCWQESPAARPTIASVKQQIKKLRRGCHLDGANLMDNLLQRMERYTDNLESLVEQKTAELMEEKKRSEELLYEMLPRFVVDQLRYGHSVTPEAYDAVTISFSDIKDFTSIAAQSSPIEVVNLLNHLYTEFDDCIAQYDVYKVETIGDAYMVVSGLPVRNGDLHAKEIAEMSLALLDLIRNFDIPHLPHVNLELRIGIHSGPCASGVVGSRMFRYCLFGDTVNTASRMESHGEPMKIHISQDSATILSKFGIFGIEPRGQVEIKGKGMMNTYWLNGKLSSANG